MFPCIDTSHFVHSSVIRQLDCFHFLTIINNVALSIHIQVFVWTYVFNSLGVIPRIGMKVPVSP